MQFEFYTKLEPNTLAMALSGTQPPKQALLVLLARPKTNNDIMIATRSKSTGASLSAGHPTLYTESTDEYVASCGLDGPVLRGPSSEMPNVCASERAA